MITSIGIENFRAFGERMDIPLRPVTLFFGANSVGKSTILNVFNLFKQSIDYGEKGRVLVPRVKGGIRDLGSYQDFVNDHDVSKNIKIEIGYESKYQYYVDAFVANGVTVEYEFNFSAQSREIGFASLTFKYRGEMLARFEPVDKLPYFLLKDSYNNGYDPSRSSEHVLICTEITSDLDFWDKILQMDAKRGFELLDEEEAKRKADWRLSLWELRAELKSIERSNIKAIERSNNIVFELKSLIKGSRLARSLLDFEQNDVENTDPLALLKRVIDLQRVIESMEFFCKERSPKNLAELASHLIGKIALPHNGLALRPIRFDQALSDIMSLARLRLPLDVLRGLDVLCIGLNRDFSSLLPLGPFRNAPERFYMFSGTRPSSVGRKGESLSDLIFKDQDVLLKTNKWLQRLNLGYEMNVRPLGENNPDLYEVLLRDISREPSVEVNLTDVGFGVSQILPFVVQAVSASNQIISIEQPEVHIHPKLQADLGDLLAEVANSDRNVQLLIETHSEHLVLRLQKLIRDGKLSKDKVAIINITKGPSGSTAQHMLMDDSGEFLTEWPGGFFTERLNELF